MSYQLLRTYGYARLYELDSTLHGGIESVIARSGMDIDADGAWGPPGSYAPPGSGLTPLDILSDGGWPHSWYGGPTDGAGKWVVQGPHDPAPGYIVSGTSWKNPDNTVPDKSQRKYVDALTVPYWVRPLGQSWIQNGQVGIAMYKEKVEPFVVADAGPPSHYGEGSIALANKLGVPPSATHGGVSAGVFSLIFTDARIKWGDWSNIDVLSHEVFTKWGGLDKLQNVIGTIWS
jgi:hypothetical protein